MIDNTQTTTYISIDDLVALRNRLTNRRDEQIDYSAVDEIDAQLRTIQPGQDNRVDLLLGRPEAVLPVREGYFVNPAVTLELEAETISVFDAEMRRLCADYEPVDPDYPGMWK